MAIEITTTSAAPSSHSFLPSTADTAKPVIGFLREKHILWLAFTGNSELIQRSAFRHNQLPVLNTRSALRWAKVKYRRPYQTRHTYASMMLTAGEPIAWLAQQMGHSDWAMNRKTYAKYIKDAGEKAVKMFAENAAKKLAR